MRFGARTIALTAFSAIAVAAAPVMDGASVSAYLRQTPAKQFYLPEGLTEISGLAVASNNTVYAHDDNYAIVYEVDLSSAKTLKAFALGNPTVKADFEDIAVRGGYVYLLTSDGRLFEAPVGENRKRVLYNAYDTGVGVHCEADGLANGPAEGDFLILCKKTHEVGFKDRLVIYSWNLHARTPVATPWLNVSLDGLVEKLDQGNFHPSAFVWRRDRGTLLIVSAKGHSAIEIDQHGRLVDRIKLDKEEHPQPEGLALMADGRLVLSDEGSPGQFEVNLEPAESSGENRVPGMVERGFGRVLAVSSPFATDVRPKQASYAIAKAAEEVMIRSLAREVADTGVTANLLLVRTIAPDHTSADELSETLAFLASPAASAINGARIPLEERT